MNDLEIEYLSLGALTSYPRNARTHSKKQIRQIADSIKQFGFTNPILIDSSNMILAGHGRLGGGKTAGSRQGALRPARSYDDSAEKSLCTRRQQAGSQCWLG